MANAGSKFRKWAIGLVILGAAAAGYGYWRKQNNDKPPAIRYETATVDRGRIVAKVTATGTLSALVTVQVGAQVSGRIAELGADFNSEVQKGDMLVRIDPQLFQAAVEQARANYMASKGDLAKAKAQAGDADVQLRRAKQLAENHFIAQADHDTARANAAAAHASVAAADGHLAQAKASLHQAEVNLTYTTIYSPIHGTVIQRNVDVGQTVAASLQAPTLFLIAEDLRRMQVDTSVAEADIGKLSDKMEAQFTVDAWPNETFRGSVRQIRNAPQTVQNVVTYDAVIDVENPKLQLKPGMTATITFIYAKKDDALRVTNAALRFKPPESLGLSLPDTASATAKSDRGEGKGKGDAASLAGTPTGTGEAGRGHGSGGWKGGKGKGDPTKRTVWVLRAGKPVAVPVKTGISDGSLTEIVQGELKPGDVIITDAIETDAPKPTAAMPGMGGGMGGGGMGGGGGGGRRGL